MNVFVLCLALAAKDSMGRENSKVERAQLSLL